MKRHCSHHSFQHTDVHNHYVASNHFVKVPDSHFESQEWHFRLPKKINKKTWQIKMWHFCNWTPPDTHTHSGLSSNGVSCDWVGSWHSFSLQRTNTQALGCRGGGKAWWVSSGMYRRTCIDVLTVRKWHSKHHRMMG